MSPPFMTDSYFLAARSSLLLPFVRLPWQGLRWHLRGQCRSGKDGRDGRLHVIIDAIVPSGLIPIP